MAWDEPMNEPKPKTAKPFEISKWIVWDAYEKVKANQGAAGVDGESIAEFEENLKGNLYRLWLCRVEDCAELVMRWRRSPCSGSLASGRHSA